MSDHPEHLFEKWAKLTPAEREVLLTHTQTCAACRLEVEVLEELAAVEPADDAIVEVWVERSMQALGADALRPRGRPRTHAKTVFFAIAATLVIGLAAAAWRMSVVSHPAPAVPVPVATSASSATVFLPPTPTSAPIPSVAPSSQPAPSAPLVVVAPESVETMFERANRDRRQGQTSESIAGYRALMKTYPGSPQAATSHVTLGKILLNDRNDASGALAEFDAYLADASRTELREEAMVLRATALGKLGRHDEETRALEEFLRQYPSSLEAPRAQARLHQLR